MSGRSWIDDQGSLSHTQAQFPHSCGNVYRLIARREICPRTKCCPKKLSGEPRKGCNSLFELKNEAEIDARSGISSWVEEDSLKHLSAEYCPLEPPPKSTIAAAFSLDGRKLASTHGDHTVKIIDSETGTCLKVLKGHQRTPWVVRFHPELNEILASGSLDHEVRVWDASTSECIASRHFYRPIASIAFHAEGEFLAVASGHKLYLWQYKETGESSSPVILLKTRRSLRAVNFHPHAAPFLLTAEVNDLDFSDPSMSRATSLDCLHCSPRRLHKTNVHLMDHLRVSAELPLMPFPSPYPSSSSLRDYTDVGFLVPSRQESPHNRLAKSTISMQIQIDSNLTEHNDPVETPPITPVIQTGNQDRLTSFTKGEESPSCGNNMDVNPSTLREVEAHGQSSTSNQDIPGIRPLPIMSNTFELPDPSTSQHELSGFNQQHFLPDSYSASSELPSVQQHLVSEGQAGMHPRLPQSSHLHDYPRDLFGAHYTPFTPNSSISNRTVPIASLTIPPIINSSLVESGSDVPLQLGNVSLSPENGIPNPLQRVDTIPIIGVIPSGLSASFSASPSAELPCTVKLRIWSHDAQNISEPLDDGKCRLIIPHAVLCSEMGAHFSPCGRYLAACVACVLPKVEAESRFVSQFNQDGGAAGLSPTRHPTIANQVLYELRIYSLEESNFGSVLVSRAVRAAHCLTSIQFSPTSEHLLLAYGRRHSSLLKSIVINGEISLPVYTVLEVYRVSDLQLVSLLPSAEDEVNVACFHPSVGGGLVYGTKEGKLRILKYDGSYKMNYERSNVFPAAKIVEVQAYALEC